MNGKTTYREPPIHRCVPGWHTGINGNLVMDYNLPGDVWTCDCGKQWEAQDAPSNYATVGQRTCNAVTWLPVRQQKSRWWRR